MPQGALAAARMNAEHNSSHDVRKMLEFAFSDGRNQYRLGWGMLDAGTQWGGKDVGGLIGSITDGGGYAFMGNGLWTLAAVSPIPLYDRSFARVVAKWTYNLANAAKYFFGDSAAVSDRQSNPGDHWDTHTAVAYEGLRKCDYNRTAQRCLHGATFGPFATGDWCEMANCTNVTWACPSPRDALGPCNSRSDRALYGGGSFGSGPRPQFAGSPRADASGFGAQRWRRPLGAYDNRYPRCRTPLFDTPFLASNLGLMMHIIPRIWVPWRSGSDLLPIGDLVWYVNDAVRRGAVG
jgi:hypothetical protein